MYEIKYQKANGDIFTRKRFSKPIYSVEGKGRNAQLYTSMGWLIVDIKRV